MSVCVEAGAGFDDPLNPTLETSSAAAIAAMVSLRSRSGVSQVKPRL